MLRPRTLVLAMAPLALLAACGSAEEACDQSAWCTIVYDDFGSTRYCNEPSNCPCGDISSQIYSGFGELEARTQCVCGLCDAAFDPPAGAGQRATEPPPCGELNQPCCEQGACDGELTCWDDACHSVPWTDPGSGLMWETSPTPSLDVDVGFEWQQALDHCAAATVGGHDDWRVPTISELRTLVRDCPATNTGGACAVTDACTDYDTCFDFEGCYCDPGVTGHEREAAWHRPTEIGTFARKFWSSTTAMDSPFCGAEPGTCLAWVINFNFGDLRTLNKDYEGAVLCVRTP